MNTRLVKIRQMINN